MPLAVALVALAAAVGGEAVADQVASVAKKLGGGDIAKNAITGKHVKKNSIKSPDVAGLTPKDFKKSTRAKLKGEKGDTGAAGPVGPAGAPGAPGAAGATGAPGANGADGAAGADGFGGGMGHTLFQSGATNGGVSFAALYGASNAASVTDEDNASVLSPNTTIVISDLAVRLATAPGAGQSRTVALRDDGVDTALSCTVSNTDTQCLSTASVQVAARSVLSLKSTATAGVGTTQTAYSFIARSP